MRKAAKDYYDEKISKFPDAAFRMFERQIIDIEQVKKIHSIHIIGVCGTAMGSLAGLLVQAGYSVSGSDTDCYPPMSDLINDLGIKFYKGFDADNLIDKDCVVVGNACGPQNVEAEFARENNLLQLSIGEALRHFFLLEKMPLVVTGTHGKTTTTGLLAHVLQYLESEPGFMVGGVMIANGKSYEKGMGKYFAIEGDEYDTAYFDKAPKFLHYNPYGVIVTSIEFDHIDIYKDMADYTQAFEFLATEINPNGILVLCAESSEVLDLAKYTEAKVVTYGINKGDFTARDLADVIMPIPGEHNLLNALSVYALLTSLGFDKEKIKKGLEAFGGMKRRQEVILDNEKVTIIEDFAHHPTAVRETVKAIKNKYIGRRIIAVFEPRSNTSRRKTFEDEYIKSFMDADKLLLKVPPLRHNDNPDDFMDSERVVNEVTNNGTIAKLYHNVDEIVSNLKKDSRAGDVILIMSNGSFDGIYGKLVSAFSQ